MNNEPMHLGDGFELPRICGATDGHWCNDAGQTTCQKCIERMEWPHEKILNTVTKPAGNKRYVAESLELRSIQDGVPFVVRLRLMLDRDNKRVRAVRSATVVAEDGSSLPRTDCAYIDDQWVTG